MSKRLITAFIAAIAILTAFTPTTLNSTEIRLLRFQISNNTFTIDGVVQEHNDYEWSVLGANSTIFIDPYHNRSMVPTWMIWRAFNAFFDFCHTNQHLLIMRDGILMRFSQDEYKPYGMGVTRIHQDIGAWFIPLRYVAEAFGEEVIWDAAAQAVYVIID